MLTPTMHPPFEMNTRVRLPDCPYGGGDGTIVGIAATNILFHYIVLLDKPKQTEYGEMRAVSISGCELVRI